MMKDIKLSLKAIISIAWVLYAADRLSAWVLYQDCVVILYVVSSTELFDVSQPLELWSVDDPDHQRVQLNVTMDGVVEHLQSQPEIHNKPQYKNQTVYAWWKTSTKHYFFWDFEQIHEIMSSKCLLPEVCFAWSLTMEFADHTENKSIALLMLIPQC